MRYYANPLVKILCVFCVYSLIACEATNDLGGREDSRAGCLDTSDFDSSVDLKSLPEGNTNYRLCVLPWKELLPDNPDIGQEDYWIPQWKYVAMQPYSKWAYVYDNSKELVAVMPQSRLKPDGFDDRGRSAYNFFPSEHIAVDMESTLQAGLFYFSFPSRSDVVNHTYWLVRFEGRRLTYNVFGFLISSDME